MSQSLRITAHSRQIRLMGAVAAEKIAQQRAKLWRTSRNPVQVVAMANFFQAQSSA
jgi:hypothetical protein